MEAVGPNGRRRRNKLNGRDRRLLAVAGFALKVALTPLGKPEAVNFTLPLNPLRALIEILVEPDVPWRIVRFAGDAERVKLGCVEDEGPLVTRLAALTVASAPYARATQNRVGANFLTTCP